jgi:SAM-dependent methyltransferase
MDHLEKTRIDWTAQALEADNAASQIARPGDEDSLAALAGDVRAKLKMTDSVSSLADIGCGNGLLLSKLVAPDTDVAGVDYADAMVSEAKGRFPRGEFYTQGSVDLPFETGRFDRILCYSIMHYFPSDLYASQTVSELIRIAAPGAIILIGDILDQTYEQEIKDESDLEIEKNLPMIHRYSAWRFYELSWLVGLAEAQGAHVEILGQPDTFRLQRYRRDLRLTLR